MTYNKEEIASVADSLKCAAQASYAPFNCGAKCPAYNWCKSGTDGFDKDKDCIFDQAAVMLEDYMKILPEPLKPLTADEMIAYVQDKNSVPVLYWLSRDSKSKSGWEHVVSITYGIDFSDQNQMDFIRKAYGSRYVVFTKKPSDDEIAAVQWRD